MPKQVETFTDDSCPRDPGPGGYNAIMRYRQHEKTLGADYRLTTNNRMELIAAIVTLEALKEHYKVVLSADSQYVHQGITQWTHNQKKHGQKTAEKKPVRNTNLWQRLGAMLDQHKVRWERMKGYAGHSGNEHRDELTRTVVSHPTQGDIGYQSENQLHPLRHYRAAPTAGHSWVFALPDFIGLSISGMVRL